MDPSNLAKMARGKNGAVYNKTLAAVNRISMAQTGQPFDVGKAMGDYKYATMGSTYNTLNFLNSLTGRDNKSGNLGTLIDMSDKLNRSEFPPLNAVEQWAKLSAGNEQIAAFRGTLVEVADQTIDFLGTDDCWTCVFDEVKVFPDRASAEQALDIIRKEQPGLDAKWLPWIEEVEILPDGTWTAPLRRDNSAVCCTWICPACEGGSTTKKEITEC